MSLTFPGSLGSVNAEAGTIDSFQGIAANFSTIPSGRALTVDTSTQVCVFSSFTITGGITINGELRVTNWPT